MQDEGFRKERAAVLVISVFMLGAFLISFLLQSLLAKFFGPSATLDAFTVGNSLAYLFINWIAYGAVSIILVPVFTEYRLSRNGQTVEAANTFITLLFLVSLLLTIVCIVAAKPIIAVMGRGFDAETRALAVNLCRMIMPVFPIVSVCGILSGLLRAYERYNITPIARCFELMPVIAALLLLRGPLGIYAVPVGMITGACLSLAIHMYCARGIGLRFRIHLSVQGERTRAMLRIFFYFGLVSMLQHLVFVVDRLVASFLSPGSVSLYHFASRFQMLIVMILPIAVSIPFYTKLNEHLHARDESKVRETIHDGLRLVAVTIIPLFTLLVALRIPVIELWLEYGAFTSVDTKAVATVFLCLAPSFLMEAMAPIAFHIFFSLRDTRVLRVLAVIVGGEVLSNIILDLVLVGPLGLNGIGLATTLVKLPTTFIGWIFIGRCVGGLELRSLTPDVLKILAASLCMVPVVMAVNGYLGGVLGSTAFDRFLRVGILFVVGPSTYIPLCLLFRVREVAGLARVLRGAFSR